MTTRLESDGPYYNLYINGYKALTQESYTVCSALEAVLKNEQHNQAPRPQPINSGNQDLATGRHEDSSL